MSFLTQDDNTYINIKLTDTGRRRLAQGALTFDAAVFSDREINYAFDRRYDAQWNLNPNFGSEIILSGNSVFAPKDDHPQLNTTNYDGSQAYPLTTSIHVKNVIMTADTGSIGFWSAVTEGTREKIGQYYLKDNWFFSGFNSTGIIDGSQDFTFSTSNLLNGTIPNVGQLVYMRGAVAVDTLNNFSAETEARYNNLPLPSMWYRVVNAPSVLDRTLDRRGPFYAAASGNDKTTPYFVYQHDSIDEYYGSAVTVNCPVWNLSIARTSREIGHARKAVGGNSGHSYTNYGSRGYAGAKEFFDFDQDQRQVGFIHYSNEHSGQTYWDAIVPGATEVDMPDLMWHRTTDSSGNYFLSGSAVSSGHRFTDFGSEIMYDEKAQTNYTWLKDGITGSPLTVGRVYYDLKLIVITDPELLTAMTYKANRNWTLPPMEFSTSSNPKLPFNSINKPGFMKSNHNYYATYVMEPGQVSYDSPTVYNPIRNFGQFNFLHCGYIQKLSGYTDENGNRQHLRGRFPQGWLPFMRNNQTLEAFSGTGWGANKVQILVQEVPINRDGGADSLHPGKWSGCSDLSTGDFVQDPAGVFAIGNPGSQLIEASQLYDAEFIVSQADITTGSTMPLYTTGSTNNLYGLLDFFNGYTDEFNNGMPFGGESHFFGNIKTVRKKVRYDTFMTIVVGNNELNTSLNESFDVEKDPHTYITEVGVLNSEGELVAVGKPTHPIRKDSGDWKVLQLKLEF